MAEDKVLTLNRPAVCTECGEALPSGSKARYYSATKIYHEPPCNPKNGQAAKSKPNLGAGSGAPRLRLFAQLLIDAGEMMIQRLEDIEKYKENEEQLGK